MEAAKMVMGPRPGLVIVRVWQGAVEIVLRIILIVFCVATLIASAIALHHVQANLDPSVNRTTNNRVEEITSLNYGSMLFNSRAAGGTGIAIAILTIIYELVPIILRFLNIGLVNYKIKIFLGIDVVITFILASVLAIVGILAAYLAVFWARIDGTDSLNINGVARAINVLAATAGTSLLTSFTGSILMVWTVLFLVYKWNDKIIKETLKSAF